MIDKNDLQKILDLERKIETHYFANKSGLTEKQRFYLNEAYSWLQMAEHEIWAFLKLKEGTKK